MHHECGNFDHKNGCWYENIVSRGKVERAESSAKGLGFSLG